MAIRGDEDQPYRLIRVDTIREADYDYEPYERLGPGWVGTGQVVCNADRDKFEGLHVLGPLLLNGSVSVYDARTIESHPRYFRAPSKKRKNPAE